LIRFAPPYGQATLPFCPVSWYRAFGVYGALGSAWRIAAESATELRCL
jgi:hypothetical protein